MDINTQYARAWAAENVWSAPRASGHYRLQPRRLTVSAGAFRQVSVATTREDTPDRFSRWHIYQIGGIDPNFFNMFYRVDEWISLIEVMNHNKLMTNVYAANGVEVPRSDVFYKFNAYGNFLMAVRINKLTKFNYSTDTLSFRMFANRWWNTEEGVNSPTPFKVVGRTVEGTGQISAFIASYNADLAAAEHPFQVNYWRNGVRQAALVPSDIKVGDAVEYIVDGSIYRRHETTIGTTPFFSSTRDTRQKYLVHLPKPDSITFPEMRMADFYVRQSSRKESTYLHANSDYYIRGLTHNDFSVAANVVNSIVSNYNTMWGSGTNLNNYRLEVFMRRSEVEHDLVLDTSFVAELYKLPESEIVKAMVGVDAVVPFWTAAALEQSGYNAIIYADKECDITGELLEKGLGYYATARILANTPLTVKSPGANGYVELPFMLCRGSTVYEYDAQGHFLGWSHHYTGNRFFVKNELATRVEVISGLGGNLLEETHGRTELTLAQDRNWKVYSRQRVGGIFTGKPVDVTGTNKYSLVNGVFKWLDTDISRYPTVRSDARFFAADYNVVASEGILQIPIITSQMHGDLTSTQPIGIPLGQLDVIFNGRSLIYGIEYFYRDGTIFITAKQYIHLGVNGLHKVHIRFMGFCREDMSIWPEGDAGFVFHGKVSHNLRYNLRFGRVMRAVVAGGLTDINTPAFAEDDAGPDPDNPLNGKPYVVKDIFVPLRPYMSKDTWTMIKEANDRSKIVSDFLTKHNPSPVLTQLQTVQGKHMLYSPFMGKIISDMSFGRLVLPNTMQFTQQQVSTICKNYEYLLEVDPTRMKLDDRFVIIQPHLNLGPISVQANAYAFLDAVNRFYLSSKVTFGNAVSVYS